MSQTAEETSTTEFLADLWIALPQLRFGQLVLFAATLAHEGDAQNLATVADDELVGAIKGYLSKRGGVACLNLDDLLSPYGDILRYVDSRPVQTPLLPWLLALAEQEGPGLYDVEDHQLLAALQRERA